MVSTPIFGPFDVSRSSNMADNRLVNLYAEISETRQGRSVGALYGFPGKKLLSTVGAGPIRGTHVMNNLLYVASGSELYSVDANFSATLLGTIVAEGAVSMVDNGTQVAIFVGGGNGYIAPIGHALSGGTISTAGAGYVADDTIVLTPSSGTQIAAAQLTVNAVGGSGDVTAFRVLNGGSFSINPISFTQGSTSGSGTNFTLTAPTFAAASTMTSIVMPFGASGVITAEQQDGFCLINQPGSYLFFQSDLLDASLWNPLNFGSASGDPDFIEAMIQIHRELWLIKQENTEIWYNAGTTGLTFARLDGAHPEVGCAAPKSARQCGETIIWLGKTHKSGQGVIFQSHGHTVSRVSTSGLEDIIRKYSDISDAVSYSFQTDGHEFYVLNFPTADATWCYDITTSNLLKTPMWSQLGYFSGGVLHRDIADNCVFFNGKHVAGDYQNGNLYELSLEALTDNGVARKVLRSWRALEKPSDQPVRFSELCIYIQTGIGVVTENPQMVLRWSDDGGHTWSNEKFASVGKVGETSRRLLFSQLGSTRRDSGLDRIFELSSTDQFPVAIVGAVLEGPG
jgi:hypothetical protein